MFESDDYLVNQINKHLSGAENASGKDNQHSYRWACLNNAQKECNKIRDNDVKRKYRIKINNACRKLDISL